MRRSDNFAFRVSEIERTMISDLAKRLRRSESDAVRLIIREAVLSLQSQDQVVRGAASNAARDAARVPSGVTNASAT